MEKIKSFLESEKGKDIMIVIIVILVGLGSFELGRLSKENGSGGVKIEYPDQNSTQTANVVSATNEADVGPQNQNSRGTTSAANTSPSTGKTFFASSKGKKYYTISCSAGKTIKQENRVYFTTGEEAEAAGYTLSSSCN
jgi:hypothetical protein